ncbi:MAG: hypothetical protein ACFFAN_13485 [Promethearchaeota archaeon]
MNLSDILNIDKEKLIQSNSIKKQIEKIEEEKKILLPSGSKNIDNVLNGGFRSGNEILIFGSNKTGKTQLCHQICVQAFKIFSKKREKFNKKSSKFTWYLDLENTFRPERIKQIAIARNLNYNEVFKSINVAKIMSNSALLLKLKFLEDQEPLEKENVLIIDSINNYYRSEQGNKDISFHKIKTTYLKILKKINELTKKLNLITILTAQVAPNFVKGAIIKEIPVGNQYLNHFFKEYLYLNVKGEEYSYIHLVNSQLFPEKKKLYKITSEGIIDCKI